MPVRYANYNDEAIHKINKMYLVQPNGLRGHVMWLHVYDI